MIRQYSWRREPIDLRDHGYSSARSPRSLVPRYSLRAYQPRIWDQGPSSSCVAHACNRAAMVRHIIQYQLRLDRSNRDDGTYSRAITYYNARWIEGDTSIDAGCYIRNGMKAMNKWGACSESLCPYRPDDFARKPAWYCYLAILGRLTAYQRVEVSVDAVRQAIADGYPVVGGFDVYPSFAHVASDGVVPLPGGGEESQGGHAIVYIGWDDSRRMLEFANSYGTEWGDGGCGWMPYDYVTPRRQGDFWAAVG